VKTFDTEKISVCETKTQIFDPVTEKTTASDFEK
jgi:hypothetical protein